VLLVPALAVVTEAIVTCPTTPLVLRYVPPRRAGVVVVMDALVCWFIGLVNGIERSYLRHGTPLLTTGYSFSTPPSGPPKPVLLAVGSIFIGRRPFSGKAINELCLLESCT